MMSVQNATTAAAEETKGIRDINSFAVLSWKGKAIKFRAVTNQFWRTECRKVKA